MKPIELFKPEDFFATHTKIGLSRDRTFCAYAASANANAKLTEWLQSQPVVYGKSGANAWFKSQTPTNSMGKWEDHTARLVCIEPITKDTAEGLLREFLQCGEGSVNWGDVMNRARKLLSGEG